MRFPSNPFYPIVDDVRIDQDPDRAKLLRELESVNQRTWWLIGFLAMGIVALIFLIDWQRIPDDPIVAIVAGFSAVGSTLAGLLMLWSSKRKRVQDLREETRFGQYDKYDLGDLYLKTLQELHLDSNPPPLFISAGRQINAASMRVYLGPFFRSLNGIYLERQTIHKLEPEEIQDILGHELGHYFRYSLVLDRFLLLEMCFSVLLCVFIAQLVGLDGPFGYVAVAIAPQILSWCLASTILNQRRAIEYLCDDFGAQVHGVATSINGLLKIAAEQELQSVIMQQVYLSNLGSNLSDRALIETVMESIPYGATSPEEMQRKVEAAVKLKSANQKPSLGGFIDYVWNSEANAVAAEEMEERSAAFKKLLAEPKLEWENLIDDPSRRSLSEAAIAELVTLIEANPSLRLFRFFAEDLLAHDYHPPLRKRILFLWRNREAIEAERAKRRIRRST